MRISRSTLLARAAQNRQRIRSAVNRVKVSERKLQREIDRLRRRCR